MKKFLIAFFTVVILLAATLGGMELWAPDKYKPSNWGTTTEDDGNGGKEEGGEQEPFEIELKPEKITF